MEQLYFIGMKSVLVVCLTGAFTGMVLGFQGYYTLVQFGSEGMLGTAVALTLIRELGPVLTAIMVTEEPVPPWQLKSALCGFQSRLMP